MTTTIEFSEDTPIIIEMSQSGPIGQPGPQGEAATIEVGTVTTLPAGSAATVTNVGTESAAVFDFGIPKGDKGDPGSGPGGSAEWGDITGTLSDQTDLQDALDKKVDAVVKTVTGDVITFTANNTNSLLGLQAEIEPVQDLHGQASPYPAGGGVNKFDPDSVTDGYIDGSGNARTQSSTSKEVYSDYIPVLPSTDYVVGYNAYASGEEQWESIAWYDENKVFLSRPAGTGSSFRTYTSPANASYARAQTRTYDHGLDGIYFGVGSSISPSPYAPYSNICPISGHTQANIFHETAYDADADPAITISLGQTVYGGTVDPLTGTLTVTWGSLVVDGTINQASGLGVHAQDSEFVNVRGYSYVRLGTLSKTQTGPYFCSHFYCYSYAQRRNALVDTVYQNSSKGQITWTSSTYTTLEEFNGYLQEQNANGTPVTVCYELATPVTVQFTPQQIASLIGTNVMWADTGAITAEIYAQLGSLAFQDSVDYTSAQITNKPTLGNLASQNTVNYATEVTNKPTIPSGALASMDAIDYTSTYLTNKPTLGAMAAVDDAPSDDKPYGRKNGAWSEITGGGGGGSAAWGDITGTLSNQTDLQAALDGKANLIVNTVSGRIASITDGTNNPVIGLTVGIEPVQSGSGDPAPDNIRPISGWTEINLRQMGRNLVDCQNAYEDMNESDGWYVESGSHRFKISGLPANTDFTLSCVLDASFASDSQNRLYLIGSSSAYIDLSQGIGRWSVTKPSTAAGEVIVSLNNTCRRDQARASHILDLQVELGKHMTDYDAYTNALYTITLGQTVLAGTYDVTTGVLTVTHVEATFDGTGWVSGTIGGSSVFQHERPAAIPSGVSFISNYITKVTAILETADNVGYFGGTYFNVKMTSATDLSTFTSMLNTSPMQVVYKLAEPLTYQLTGQALSTKYGGNTFQADTGWASLTYKADLKLYVDAKIRELQ